MTVVETCHDVVWLKKKERIALRFGWPRGKVQGEVVATKGFGKTKVPVSPFFVKPVSPSPLKVTWPGQGSLFAAWKLRKWHPEI